MLCARIAGDRERPVALRMAAAAAAAPLGAGVYLSFSRGALVALVGGLIVLLVLAPTWTQLRGTAIAFEAAVAGTVLAAVSGAVRTLSGDTSTRETEGALVLLGLVLVMALAAALMPWTAAAEAADRTRLGRLPLPTWAGTAAAVLVVALVAVPVVVARGGDGPSQRARASRFTTSSSKRYEYWKVALRSFADHPVQGVGSGGFRAEWVREHPEADRVRDAHSLELETLGELGLIGALLLAALLGGVALSARAVQRSDPALAAGPAAALVVFAVHSAVDWDWELPAVSLPMLALAGLLAARADAA